MCITCSNLLAHSLAFYFITRDSMFTKISQRLKVVMMKGGMCSTIYPIYAEGNILILWLGVIILVILGLLISGKNKIIIIIIIIIITIF